MCKISVLLISTFMFLLTPAFAADGAAGKEKSASSPAAKKIGAASQKKAGSKAENTKQANKPQRLGKKQKESGAEGKKDKQAPAPEEAASESESTGAMRLTGRVIHGSVHGELEPGKKVAVVDISGVFEVIPAYKKIQRENLKKTKAQYHILIAQANEEFTAAVEAEALHGGFGLVIEKGGVTGVQVVDISEKLKARLKK